MKAVPVKGIKIMNWNALLGPRGYWEIHFTYALLDDKDRPLRLENTWIDLTDAGLATLTIKDLMDRMIKEAERKEGFAQLPEIQPPETPRLRGQET